MIRFVSALDLTAFAGAALAHGGVSNPMVMARMNAMSAIAAEVKALTRMTRGAVAFGGAGARDIAALEEALGALGPTCKSCHGSFKIES